MDRNQQPDSWKSFILLGLVALSVTMATISLAIEAFK